MKIHQRPKIRSTAKKTAPKNETSCFVQCKKTRLALSTERVIFKNKLIFIDAS